MISWIYYPAWINDLRNRFPADYEAVSPGELANLFRSSLAPSQDAAGNAAEEASDQ